MSNPFRFGDPVTGDFFVGREKDIAEIMASAKNNKNTVIIGDRHIGKSSLLAEAARRNSRDFLFVRVDAYGIADENRFLDAFTREAIVSGIGKAWRIDPALWELLSTRRMRAAISIGGDLRIAGKIQENLPERLREEAARSNGTGSFADVRDDIRMCPTCGKPLKWVEKYSRHYCYSCKKYAPKQRKVREEKPRPRPNVGDMETCPHCRTKLQYVHRYSDYYCDKCDKYPNLEIALATTSWSRDDMNTALDLPQDLAKLKEKHVVVLLDEFQELALLEDARMLETMRLRFEEHEDVSYVFAGCDEIRMKGIFEDEHGAFYKFGRSLELGAIDGDELKRFLMGRFKSGGGKLTEDEAERIAGVSEGIPYYAQHIGHELFHISHLPTMDDVEMAIDKVVNQHSKAFSMMWESIRSPLHRKYLVAIAREPKVPRGENFVRRHGLRSRSHVQRIESQLKARGITDRGEIKDPILVQWLRKRNPV